MKAGRERPKNGVFAKRCASFRGRRIYAEKEGWRSCWSGLKWIERLWREQGQQRHGRTLKLSIVYRTHTHTLFLLLLYMDIYKRRPLYFLYSRVYVCITHDRSIVKTRALCCWCGGRWMVGKAAYCWCGVEPSCCRCGRKWLVGKQHTADVCVCLYIYVCMCVCMCVYIYVCMYVCIHVYVSHNRDVQNT